MLHVTFQKKNVIVVKSLLKFYQRNCWIKNAFEILVGGGILEWIDDGYCDDVNNNDACEYDGGDCCGTRANKEFCLDCKCISKCLFTSYYHSTLWFLL